MKLSNELDNLDRYPFHMPGHKRNPKFDIIGTEIDITEIDGFDNLHSPNGVILDIENRLSNLYSSKKSFLMVNGSTVGILSAIFAVCDEGDKIIVARNCHKSVFNACFLRKLRVVYIEPEFDNENGFYREVKQEAIDKAINDNQDAKAIVITSPTYEGITSNINSSLPLIIDSAHGAHLFNSYPKGDIVISSLHKTLPALTQTAVANIYNDMFTDRFKLYLDIFETSSPSYILMASVDKCLDYIEKYGYELNEFTVNLKRLKQIEVDDKSKIVISTANTNISGVELADILRNEYRFEVEMASINYVILITTIGDEQAELEKLSNALIKIDNKVELKTNRAISKPTCPKEVQFIEYGKSVERDFISSVGCRSNEFVYAYPPDIPILCPNEIITQEICNYIIEASENGVNLISESGFVPNKILTKQEL